MSSMPHDDRSVALGLLEFLGSSRISLDVSIDRTEAVTQVEEIDNFLTEQLVVTSAVELAAAMRKMKGACRKFLQEVDIATPDVYYGTVAGNENAAQLGELRARIGQSAYVVSRLVGLELVGELARIIPPSPE